MVQYDFPQLTPSEPVKLVRLSDLNRVLTTERLHGRIWPVPPSRRARISSSLRFVSMRRPHHPIVRRARMWAGTQILNDLQNGILVACVRSEDGAGVRMIPSDFWRDACSGLSTGGTLLDLSHWGAVPEEIVGSTIFVFDEVAFKWMITRKINEDNPDYPRDLRKPRLLRNASIPSDSEIRAKIRSLMDRGYTLHVAAKRIGLLPGFRYVQNAHVRRIMKDCDLKPGRRPKKRQ